MTGGWLFLGISTLICVGAFLNGHRFANAKSNPFAGKSLSGLPLQGDDILVEKLRSFGRIFMVFSPLFWAFTFALCLGILGPVEGTRPILGR